MEGTNTLGEKYSSVDEMWRKELPAGSQEGDKKPEWYTKGVDYWANVPATVDGVLGVRAQSSGSSARLSTQRLASRCF